MADIHLVANDVKLLWLDSISMCCVVPYMYDFGREILLHQLLTQAHPRMTAICP